MINSIIVCDRCGKEIEEYIRIIPEPCLKVNTPIIVSALSKPKELCLDCWKECFNAN